jgi:polar amino acid transport system permease protein
VDTPADALTGPAPPGSGGAGTRPETIKAIGSRHPWRWVSAVVLVAITVGLVDEIATAPHLKWDVVTYWLTQASILDGLRVTLELTVIAMVIGVSLGALLAVMRLSANPVVSSVSWFYIWFFRGTPVLVQLFFWYNLQLVLPTLSLGIPFTPLIWHGDTLKVITPFLAAILGLGLNEAAYMAEIVRAGIISVDLGQTEAAQALGMTRLAVMRRVVLPQAMRVIIPPTGNETISMLKTTSLVYITTTHELFFAQLLVASYNYQVIALLIVASIWYIVCTSILTFGQYYLERYFARGATRQLPPTPLQRFRHMLFSGHAQPPWPASEDASPPIAVQGRRQS